MSAAEQIAASPTYRLMRFEQLADDAAEHIRNGDHLSALRCMGNLGVLFTDLAADAAQEAYNEGATKKAIADALGVTPATFRGMERTR